MLTKYQIVALESQFRRIKLKKIPDYINFHIFHKKRIKKGDKRESSLNLESKWSIFLNVNDWSQQTTLQRFFSTNWRRTTKNKYSNNPILSPQKKSGHTKIGSLQYSIFDMVWT